MRREVYRSGSRVWTYVLWATDVATTATVAVWTATPRIVDKYGSETMVSSHAGSVSVPRQTGESFNEPVYVVEVP